MESIFYSFLLVRKEKINKRINHELEATQKEREERSKGEKEEEKDGRAGRERNCISSKNSLTN